MRYIQQLDETDCGAACLAMIASYFGKSLSIAQVRNTAGTDVSGTNMNGMIQAAASYHLKGRGVKGTEESVTKSTPVPFIAHFHMVKGEKDYVDHYVIVTHIGRSRVDIWDPDPLERKKKMSREEFFAVWTGYALFLEPDELFTKTDRKENLLVKFLPIFLPHKKILMYSFLCSVLLLAFGIISSFYYKYVFDEVIFAKASVSLTTLSVGILFVSVIQTVVGSIRRIFLSHFSYKTDIQLNFSYIAHIMQLPLSFFESRKAGEILSRLGDLGKIKATLSNTVISGLMDIIMLLVSGPILFKICSSLFSISVMTVLLLSVSAAVFAKIYRSYYVKVMSENAEVQSYLFESINGIDTVKALNAELLVFGEYEKYQMKYIGTSWCINQIGIIQGIIGGIVNGLSGILIFWLGSSSIIAGTLSFGTLMTFNSLLGYFTGPLFRLINIQNSAQEALVATERVGEILELEKERQEDKEYLKPESLDGEIESKKITFRYGSRLPLYEDFSFKLKKGEWTAFVGPTGSGKSTLAKLLLKFYEPEKGALYMDGIDIRDIDTRYLREKIGYVPQDIFLFSGTIRENIALHRPDARFEDIEKAARKAGAYDFIEALPKRYDTVLGEHGGGLSGGEKQRIALARALLGNPSILILDEATSSLDTVSEMEIHTVLRSLKREHISVIIIAHRLSTVMNCDTIYVLKKGSIVQRGTHSELLAQDGLYRDMWQGMSVQCT